MSGKTIFTIAVIAALSGMMIGIMTTVPYIQTAVADKGGQPNDNAKFGPACVNAEERHEEFGHREVGKLQDDNPNNDNGPRVSHLAVFHNDRGLEGQAVC